ncbi:hypothetical protein GCM10010464_36450 [Pseudonocardia yunnanensis]|jgi:hypothetical protein|uniref:Uncharacterized protein n=1 Tax=Pseudonocardia yunnanensis TaxID=58107 RepID=A0ABW4FAC4_9PSEU
MSAELSWILVIVFMLIGVTAILRRRLSGGTVMMTAAVLVMAGQLLAIAGV